MAVYVNGINVIKDSLGYMLCEIKDRIDNETHTLFIGKLVEADQYKNEEAMSYQYYQEHKNEILKVTTDNGKQIFVTGHSEYDADTLKNEYLRDLAAGINPNIPENYFPDDDPEKEPQAKWRSHATLLYANWLNYFVYQTTPYDIMAIGESESTINE